MPIGPMIIKPRDPWTRTLELEKIRLLLGLDDVLVPGSLTKPNYNFNRTTSICLDQRGN